MSYQLDAATSLGTVKLRVSNIQRSISFYEQIIGLKAIHITSASASLTADGETVLVELVQTSAPYEGSRRGHTGLYHFALLVPSRRALGNVLQHFVEQQVAVGQADHLVSEALYLSDPDQNGIEIYRDRPRSEWKYDLNDRVKMVSDPIDWEGILAEADQAPFQGIDSGTIIGHVHLHVSDLNKAHQFYCELLGFSLESDWSANGALFVAAGRYHHHLGLNIWNGRGGTALPAHAPGIEYYTIVLANAEELNAVVERLNAAGYAAYKNEVGYMTKDPFGIGIQLSL